MRRVGDVICGQTYTFHSRPAGCRVSGGQQLRWPATREDGNMGRTLRRMAVLMAAMLGALVLTSAASASSSALPRHGATTCKGGTIHSGSYASLKIAGLCTIGNHADVVVRNDLTVGHHGILNAITHGHLVVRGDMYVRS